MTTESLIQSKIRVALSQAGCLVFRANCGKVRTADGRFFQTGLPNGFSDLFGFRKSDGRIFFIEVKNETGRIREDQKRFLAAMKSAGAIVGVARSPEDALEIIREDK